MFSLIRWYKLRRHRIGVGVHSPFAYRVVRDVIYGKGHYYAVGRMSRLTMRYPKRLRRTYEVMFRLIARLAPDGIRLSDSMEPQLELLVRMADMRPVMGRGLGGYHDGKRILTVCEALDLRKGLPGNMLRSGNMAVVRNLHDVAGILDTLKETMEGGWIFFDRRMAILVSDREVPLYETELKMT